MIKQVVTIATRESPLAIWQAHWVKARLAEHFPSTEFQLLGMSTQADRMPYVALGEIGGKGLFVKELELAILDGRADMAVHCIKDMPMTLPDGLMIGSYLAREDARDAFISNAYQDFADLPLGASVGTSSLRRQSQLLYLRPDLVIKPLRGNVNSRLKQLDNGTYDAIILAVAGLKRLNLTHRITTYLNPDMVLPAVGQGALAIECLTADTAMIEMARMLNDLDTERCVRAERAMCQQLGGGCHTPLAGYAQIEERKNEKENENDAGVGDEKEARMSLTANVATLDGAIMLQASATDLAMNAELLGITVANNLLAQGAHKILQP